MTFDPSLAFVNCPACACGEQHVQHVTANRWACNACGQEFSGPASSVTGNGARAPMTSGRRTRESVGAMLCLLLAVTVSAQTDPRTLPLVQAGDMTARGSFNLPWPWGQHALTVDGDLMTVACHDDSVGVVRIPASGTASIVTPCTNVNPGRVKPGEVNGYGIGGLITVGSSLVMSAYSFYNNGGPEPYTHVTAPNVAGLATGTLWKAGTTAPGMVSGPMGHVPPEWRALLGGPVLAAQCCISIVSRSSYGPSVAVVDPANPSTSKWLVGYPDAHQALGTFDANPPGPYYGASDLLGAVFIPAGTRSLLFVMRHGEKACYGTGASCGDPLNANQATHGYPYHLRIVAYDLAAVLAAANPWDARPYAAWDLPGTTTTELNATRGGFFDQATRTLYVSEFDPNNGAPRVRVFSVAGVSQPPPPPPPPPCDGTWGAWTRQANSESACSASGQRTFIESRLFTVTTSGPGCPASPESRTSTEACNPPVVMEAFTCWVTSAPAGYADGDVRRYIRCDTNGPTASLPNGATFTVSVPKK